MADKNPLLQLVSQGQARRAQEKEWQEARKKQFKSESVGEAITEADRLARLLEAELQWRDVAQVTIWNEQICGKCGNKTISSLGIFIFQRHRTTPNTTRRLRASKNHPTNSLLPHQNEMWHEHVSSCYECTNNAQHKEQNHG